MDSRVSGGASIVPSVWEQKGGTGGGISRELPCADYYWSRIVNKDIVLVSRRTAELLMRVGPGSLRCSQAAIANQG